MIPDPTAQEDRRRREFLRHYDSGSSSSSSSSSPSSPNFPVRIVSEPRPTAQSVSQIRPAQPSVNLAYVPAPPQPSRAPLSAPRASCFHPSTRPHKRRRVPSPLACRPDKAEDVMLIEDDEEEEQVGKLCIREEDEKRPPLVAASSFNNPYTNHNTFASRPDVPSPPPRSAQPGEWLVERVTSITQYTHNRRPHWRVGVKWGSQTKTSPNTWGNMAHTQAMADFVLAFLHHLCTSWFPDDVRLLLILYQVARIFKWQRFDNRRS